MDLTLKYMIRKRHTTTGKSGDEVLLWPELYLCVSNMRNANTELDRLTHSFPRNKITSPITLRRPIFRMLFMIKSVAIEDALKKLLPVIAICKHQNVQKVNIRKVKTIY